MFSFGVLRLFACASVYVRWRPYALKGCIRYFIKWWKPFLRNPHGIAWKSHEISRKFLGTSPGNHGIPRNPKIWKSHGMIPRIRPGESCGINSMGIPRNPDPNITRPPPETSSDMGCQPSLSAVVPWPNTADATNGQPGPADAADIGQKPVSDEENRAQHVQIRRTLMRRDNASFMWLSKSSI